MFLLAPNSMCRRRTQFTEKYTWDVSSWVLSPKRWKHSLWAHKDSTGRNNRRKIQRHPCWTPVRAPVSCRNCCFLRAKDLPNGSFGLLLWSRLWTAKSQDWSERNLPRPSNNKLFIPNPLLPSTDLLACANNGSPPPRLCTFFTNPASFKAEGKEPRIRSGLESISHRKNHHQTQWIYFVLFAPRAKRGFVRKELLVVPADTKLPSPL